MPVLIEILRDFLSSLSVTLVECLASPRRGPSWSVEPIAPEDLGRGPDSMALAYREGDRTLWLNGTWERPSGPGRIEVPAEAAWDAEVPTWARGRRGQILGRVRRNQSVRGRFELVERSDEEGG